MNRVWKGTIREIIKQIQNELNTEINTEINQSELFLQQC